MSSSKKLVIYTDGGSRGNPGPSAIGVVIGEREYEEVIGEATNNVAEYKAVILGLKKAKQILGKEEASSANIEVRSDSELVVRQLSGVYKIKNDVMGKLFIEIWNIKQDFKKVVFVCISRDKNKRADKLVNNSLDMQGKLM